MHVRPVQAEPAGRGARRFAAGCRLLAAVILGGALLLGAGAAQAATHTLDQSQTDTSGGGAFVFNTRLAQTFTAGITGDLDQVDLFLQRGSAADLTVRIEGVTSAGAPDDSVVLASASVPAASVPTDFGAWVAVSIGPTAVTAGTQYAIVASLPAAASGFYRWERSSADVYTGGSAFFCCFGGAWSAAIVTDLAFKTYVVPADTTPPTIACSASPTTLWPPNHRLRAVDVTITASDDSGSTSVTLVSVASNQADGGLGPEDVPNDIQGWTTGTDDRSGFLRAERFNAARIYTLTYEAEDAAGNSATCGTTVTVPKNQK